MIFIMIVIMIVIMIFIMIFTMIFTMIFIMIFTNIPSVAKEQKAEREDESEPRHFIDVYLAEMEKNPNDFTFEELCRCFVLIYFNLLYHSIIFDFFSAGTETSSTTMKWAVLFLSINQVFDKRKDNYLELEQLS